jgi:hypothetical protein
VNDPYGDFVTDLLHSIESQTKLKERLAVIEIVIEEIKHATTPEEIAALDRVAAAVKHRTTQGL